MAHGFSCRQVRDDWIIKTHYLAGGYKVFRRNMFGPVKTAIASALLVSTLAIGSGATAHAAGLARGVATIANGNAGALYTETNAAAGNNVVEYDRAPDGTITWEGSFATGGLGNGAGLGSQGALALSSNNGWLFAVNAGSNNISVFSVSPSGLGLVDQEASGGTTPISLTSNGDMLYVLNAGGSGNITGFTVGHDGTLSPIAGSTRPLSGSATGPAQVQFSPDGRLLAVTEKTTNRIDIYTVNKDGTSNGPMTHPAAGVTPFGFAFGKDGRLLVSEAFGGAANASAASSYIVGRDGSFQVVSASSPTHQTAACWLALTGNGRYAYTANAGSASISGYNVARDGSLSLLDPNGISGTTGAHPADLAMSINSHYLYSLNITNSSQSISAFEVHSDGSLSPVTGVTGGLPPSAVGLAAR
jgi:6-phosphogluconolactonase (cycloisomerase 2 family)